MTDQSTTTQTALSRLLASADPGELDLLTEELWLSGKGNGNRDIYRWLALLLLRESKRGRLQTLDEREEQVHPIARAQVTRRVRPEITIQDDDADTSERTLPAALRLLKSQAPPDSYMRETFPADDSFCGKCGCSFLDHVSGGNDCGEWIEVQSLDEESARLVGLSPATAHPAPASPPSGEEAELSPDPGAKEILARSAAFLSGDLERERDTLRARVTELEAAVIADNTSPSVMVSGEHHLARIQQLEGELAKRDAVVEAARAFVAAPPGADGYLYARMVSALSALDQPSEPKT